MAEPLGDRTGRERDLYRRLLELEDHRDLNPLLTQALGLMVELTGARQGYLEILDNGDSGKRWSMQHGLSEDGVAEIRRVVSRGIIAEALTTGRTILTASALLDPRFRHRESVVKGRIEAVLCAPLGDGARLGVLYLQGPGAFSPDDRADAEIFARHLARIAGRLLAERSRLEASDSTNAARARLSAPGIVGRSRALAQVLSQVAQISPLDISVLLTGETGTGKSLMARVIHDNSSRASGPFVELNCAALPEDLIESELFGAIPGAHSTATRRIPGKVAAAEGGTLLLDEVSELTLAAQAKLLQLLQAKQYFPLGAAEPRYANVRVLAAANSDLVTAVEERRFRADLYYRLHVLPLRLPSLAERRDDVVPLANHFCRAAVARHDFRLIAFSPGGLEALETAEWPGNVRQLAHVVEAAVIRAATENANWIERHHLFPLAVAQRTETGASLQESTRRFQRRVLLEALEASHWNVVEAARRVDVARSHFYVLMRSLGISRPE